MIDCRSPTKPTHYKLREDYFNSGHPTLQNTADIPEEFEDQLDHRALAFDYFDQAYTVWLDLIDDFVEPNQYLEDRYGMCMHLDFVRSFFTLVRSPEKRKCSKRFRGINKEARSSQG